MNGNGLGYDFVVENPVGFFKREIELFKVRNFVLGSMVRLNYSPC